MVVALDIELFTVSHSFHYNLLQLQIYIMFNIVSSDGIDLSPLSQAIRISLLQTNEDSTATVLNCVKLFESNSNGDISLSPCACLINALLDKSSKYRICEVNGSLQTSACYIPNHVVVMKLAIDGSFVTVLAGRRWEETFVAEEVLSLRLELQQLFETLDRSRQSQVKFYYSKLLTTIFISLLTALGY
jgi:hypothetical protein